MIFFIPLLFCSCAKKPVYPEAPSDGSAVRIALDQLSLKRPFFHTFYTQDKKGINYFVLRLDDSVESYFDACGKCYTKKLGYRQDGEGVFCRACDVSYSVHDLKDGIGSCYPIKLRGRVEGEYYAIETKDLLRGGKYF